MNTVLNPAVLNPDITEIMMTARESLKKGLAQQALKNLYNTFEHAVGLTEQQEHDLHELTAAALYAFLEQKDAITIEEQEELLDAHA
jgi:hypothetical protein